MSRTFRYKGRNVDFDLWMFPDINFRDDFDLLASMVTGIHSPVVSFGTESRFLDSFEEVEIEDASDNFQFAVGAALAAVGTAMLIPGPVDLALLTIGTALGGPVVGVIAVVAYNVLAIIMIGTGLVLMYTA